MACEMTVGFNDRTCTNGKGGIKSVLLFPVSAISGAIGLTNNQITALAVTGETYLYKLNTSLNNYD